MNKRFMVTFYEYDESGEPYLWPHAVDEETHDLLEELFGKLCLPCAHHWDEVGPDVYIKKEGGK